MNQIKITLVAAACLCALAGVRADDGSAGRSRAEVVAELRAAQTAGMLGVMNGEDSGSHWLSQRPAEGGLTRAQVRAELAAARESGELAASISEHGATLFATAPPGALTRAQVIAEMRAARASGEIAALTSEDSGAFFLAQRQDLRDRAAVYAARPRANL